MHGTTILCVRRGRQTAMAGDGQVTLGDRVMKHGARKVRRLHDGRVLAGFAGSTADAFTLFERFEGKLREHGGIMTRAAVELAKEWRSDKVLRRLEALLLVADGERTLILSGQGDVVEPDDAVAAVGSGAGYALAAARALAGETELGAEAITRRALAIAADLCVYTNDHVQIEVLESDHVEA